MELMLFMDSNPKPLVFHVREPQYYVLKQFIDVSNVDQASQDEYGKADLDKALRDFRKLERSGWTFAFLQREDGLWYFTYSRTSRRDSFNRTIGRKIAEGRLKCVRKDFGQCFGAEKPTFDDCIVLVDLIKRLEFWDVMDSVFADSAPEFHNKLDELRSKSLAKRLLAQIGKREAENARA